MKNAHFTSCLRCRSKDSIAKMLFGNNLTATESKENTTRLDARKAFDIKPGVTF